MARLTLLLLGAVLIGLGAVWTLQGFGILGGSPMTGETVWAIVGPVVVLIGLLMLVGSRRLPRSGA